jgi:hypothetical protein
LTVIRMSASVCIEASADAVWTRLAKLEDIQLRAQGIRRVEHGHPYTGRITDLPRAAATC